MEYGSQRFILKKFILAELALVKYYFCSRKLLQQIRIRFAKTKRRLIQQLALAKQYKTQNFITNTILTTRHAASLEKSMEFRGEFEPNIV